MSNFITTSFFNIEISTHVTKTFNLSNDWAMVFNNLLCSGIHHLHLYKLLSLKIITRRSKASFFNHLLNAVKNPIFTIELLVGEPSKKDIRLAKLNLLILPLKLLIPLRIQKLMAWLTTIQLTIVQENEREILNGLVIMFDPMLRHVTWHSALWALHLLFEFDCSSVRISLTETPLFPWSSSAS